MRTKRAHAALLLAVGVFCSGPAPEGAQVAVDLTLSLVLGRPTDRSITLSVLAPTTLEAFVEFGTQSGQYPESTEAVSGRAGRPFDITIGGLLGDDFSIERLIARNTLSQQTVDEVYAAQRPFLGRMAASTALFHVNGNHEEAARFLLNGTPGNPAVFAGRARTTFYPLPAPNEFYSGDAEPVEHVGLLRDYYAWTWGDALFVTIDPYWHTDMQVDAAPGDRGDSGSRASRQSGKGNVAQAAGFNRDLWQVTLGTRNMRG